jgi:hypothetical protein
MAIGNTALVFKEGGRGGSFQGEQPSSIVVDGIDVMSRRWAIAQHFTLKRTNSYGENVGKVIMRMSTNEMG